MSISKFIAFAIIAIGGIWCLVSFVSTLEAAHSYYARRGAIMRRLGSILLSRWFPAVVLIAGLAFLFVLERGIPSWIWDRGLKMTVTMFRYNAETKDLVAKVQFTNNGPTRRIILGAVFTYKPANESAMTSTVTSTVVGVGGNNTVHYFGKSLYEMSQSDIPNPIYVEPGQPILAAFSTRIQNSAPLETPGTVLGMEVHSLTANGGSNVTWVEVMEVVGDGSKSVGFITGRRETISLDAPWRNNPMETQSQLRPQLMPITILETQPSATPSPIETPSKRTADITAQELSDLVQHRGPLEAAKLMESYKGLWIEAEGEIMESSLVGGFGPVVRLRPQPFSSFQVECRFPFRLGKELEVGKEKQIIRVRGKIGHYFLLTLTLEECELIPLKQP